MFAAGFVVRHFSSRNDEAAEQSSDLASPVTSALAFRPEEAPRAALRAARQESSAATELEMIEVAAADRGIERVVNTGAGEASAALALERDLITSSAAGKIELWRRSDGALLGRIAAPAPIVAFADTGATPSPFVAALDRHGALMLIDLSDPGRPHVVPLDRSLAATEKPLAVAFSKVVPDEVVAIGSGGEVLRVDVTTGAVVSRTSLSTVRGHVPWARGGPVTIAAAKFVPEVFEDEEGVLVGTEAGGVVDVDLGRGQGKTVVEPGLVPGRILSLDRMPFGEDEVVVGASGGSLTADSESPTEPLVEHGPPVPAIALEGEDGRWAGSATGLVEPRLDPEAFSGIPVRAFGVGNEGIAALDADGEVSVLSHAGAGISMQDGEASSAVAFDAEGDLLSAYGYDPNHIEKIRAVRPQPALPGDEYAEEEEVRSYLPNRAWWSEAEDPEAFYVNDLAADKEYVVAAGQDPLGNAALVVWDASSGRPLDELTLGIGGVTTEFPTLISQVTLLPGRHEIVAYSVTQQLIAIWSTETWELEASIPIPSTGDFSVSPNESTLAIVGPPEEEYAAPEGDPAPISFIDLDTDKIDHTVKVEGANAVAFSPDGSSLAVVEGEELLQLRSPDGREAIGRRIELGSEASEIAWRPDGGLLAVGLEYEGVVLVDPNDGAVTAPLPAEAERKTLGLNWSPDGSLLATQTGKLAADETHYEPTATDLWTLSAAALRRRMCELAPCGAPKGGGPGGPLGDAADLGRIAFTFREEGDLYAANAEGETARIGQLASYPTPLPSFDWSTAGFAWSGPEQINAVLPGYEQPRTWPCACAGVAWEGSELLSLALDGSALVHIDPATGAVRTSPVHGLPTYLPDLLGLVNGHPIVAAYASEPNRSTYSRLFEIDEAGRALSLGRNAGGVLSATAPSSSADTLALVSSRSGGACFTGQRVVVITLGKDRRVVVERPPTPPSAGEFPQVRSVQVAADGSVSAAFAPISCNERSMALRRDSLAERYELGGRSWRPTGEAGFDVQAVGAGTLTLRRGEQIAEPGRLELSIGGRQVEVDAAAQGLVAAP